MLRVSPIEMYIVYPVCKYCLASYQPVPKPLELGTACLLNIQLSIFSKFKYLYYYFNSPVTVWVPVVIGELDK